MQALQALQVLTAVFVCLPVLSERDVTLTMKCADYITNKDVDSHVNVYVIATVRETNQRFATRDTIWIEKPHLEVKVSVCPVPSHIEKPHLEVKVSMCKVPRLRDPTWRSRSVCVQCPD